MTPSRSVPASGSPSCRTLSARSSASGGRRRSRVSTASPAAVMMTFREARSKSRTPSCSSSWITWAEREGCDTWQRSAARRKERRSATAAAYCSCRRVKGWWLALKIAAAYHLAPCLARRSAGTNPPLRSVLVIRYSALGDVVLATSVLEPLRARFPGARIEWVTSPAYAPLLEGLPEVERVHRLGRGGLREAVDLAVALRGRFDLAVDLQNKVKSAVVARAAGRRQLVFRRRTPRQAALALVGVDPPVRGPHATQLYADVLRPLGVTAPGRTRVFLSPDAREAAAQALGGAARPRVAVAPGASNATKRWAPERFAAVADTLAAEGP